ncbi:MAG: hypothetical protein JXQ73_26870 [Phycisphaerae bacterium]|nr:hypothetical protein [Phycisphaerae bacterium]
MDTIDVRGLPESMVQAIAESVENLRHQLEAPKRPRPKSLPIRSLGVLGPVNRESIYDYLHRDG